MLVITPRIFGLGIKTKKPQIPNSEYLRFHEPTRSNCQTPRRRIKPWLSRGFGDIISQDLHPQDRWATFTSTSITAKARRLTIRTFNALARRFTGHWPPYGVIPCYSAVSPENLYSPSTQSSVSIDFELSPFLWGYFVTYWRNGLGVEWIRANSGPRQFGLVRKWTRGLWRTLLCEPTYL